MKLNKSEVLALANKIQKQKTNAYLFNQMFWYVYGTILVCSFINWGNIATVYNIKNEKADFKFLYSLNYNEKILSIFFIHAIAIGNSLCL